MSSTLFARGLAKTKSGAKTGYQWILKNQTLAGTIAGTAIIVYDNRRGNRDVKEDADKKHKESHRYFDQKVAELKEANMATERLIISCAASTMKGFQGDTAEIENFVKEAGVFEKVLGCVRAGGC